MTALDIPDPNTTVAKLHIGSENPEIDREEVKDFIEAYLEGNGVAPSGATIIEGTGLWKGDREENLIVEIWVDSEEELEAVRDMKVALEDQFDRHCVCLSLEQRYYEH